MALGPRTKKLLSISVKFILLPAIALLLLYFAFSGLDLQSIWQAIKGADYFYVGLSFLTGYVAFVLIGLRWLIPLEALGYRHVSKINSINAVTITYITNLVIPRAGEIARCTALNQAEGLPVSKLLGTVIMERALDVVMLGLSILLTILLQYGPIERFFYELLTLRSGAAFGAKKGKKHIISTAFEHHAVLHTLDALRAEGFEVTLLPVHADGLVRPEELAAALRPDTALVSVMFANNEIGTIQPIKEIAEVAHKHGVWMHTDAVQAVGAIPVDVKELGVDMLSMSAHKFNGPKGMGALYCRKGVWPQNLIDGGSQEARHRAGTENVAGIAAMGKALEIATAHLDERMAHESELRDYVIDRVLKNIPEARLNGGRSPRLPNNVNISFPGLEGETILLDLDMHGICASTGSACNSDSLDPSHVLLSIGVPEEIGHGSMRFTFGPQNTMEEAKYLCDVLEEVIPRRRAMSCMWLQGQNTARQFSLKGEQ